METTHECLGECCVGCQLQLFFDTQNLTSSCAEMVGYQEWKSKRDLVENIIHSVLVIAGIGALISYIPMMIVFHKPEFSSPSYVYHKSIIAMEIVHMAVMTQAGFTQLLPLSRMTYGYVLYRDILRELWVLGDWMKLSTSVLTSFLSMERFFAVLSPKRFKVISRLQFAWSCVFISTVIGMVHMVPSFVRTIIQAQNDDNVTIWITESRTGREVDYVGGDKVVDFVIFSVKVFSCLATASFSIGVVIGLVLHSRKASSLTMSAHGRWLETRRLSILQLVIALMQVVDHAVWVTFNAVYDSRSSADNSGQAAVGRCWTLLWTVACQELSGVLDHSMRLPLYLLGAKKFREQFIALFKKTINSAAGHLTGRWRATAPEQRDMGQATLVSWKKLEKYPKSAP